MKDKARGLAVVQQVCICGICIPLCGRVVRVFQVKEPGGVNDGRLVYVGGVHDNCLGRGLVRASLVLAKTAVGAAVGDQRVLHLQVGDARVQVVVAGEASGGRQRLVVLEPRDLMSRRAESGKKEGQVLLN